MVQSGTIALPNILSVELDDVRRDRSNTETVVVELYVKLRPALISYVYNLVNSISDAEDLIQLAFIQLFECLEKKTEIQNPRAWLYRVVHNFAIDGVRNVSKREAILQQWVNERDTPSQESSEEDLIRRDQIEKMLGVLNEKERYCLMLRAEGLSYQEIADVIDTTPKSVSVYLARGLKKFDSGRSGK